MITYALPFFDEKEKQYLNEAFDSGWISGGKFVERFESEVSNVWGVRHCISTSNGTTALHNLYLSIGLTKYNSIIVPGFCFLAASNIALHMGIKPIFVEVDEDTWCISPTHIRQSITNNTRAIVVVHSYGNMCDMDSIMDIANEYNLNVIEDCAESTFSKYNNRYCGTFGIGGTFSMHASKIITTGEGGFVLTNNDNLNKMLSLYRSHGLPVRGTYYHSVAGHNFRLTNLQAAIGLAQMEKRDIIVNERNRVYEEYKYFLENENGITLQKITPKTEPVIWALGVKLDRSYFPPIQEVVKKLFDFNIETRLGFVASSLLDIYESHELPICESLSNSVISLPVYPKLDKVEYICRSLLSLRK